MTSPPKTFAQHKELFFVDTKSRIKDRRTASPSPPARSHPADFFLTDTLRDNKILESPEKPRVMDKQYLIHYVLNVLEEYTKNKKQPTTTLADFLLKYLEEKQKETGSVKKIANSVASSINHYQQSSPEIRFFYRLFNQKEPSVKLVQTYLQCRKVVKTFLHNKETLEGNRLSLSAWTSLVNKIFTKYPTDRVIETMKEKISENNKARALQKLNDQTKNERQTRSFNLAASLQAQKLDVEAIEFLALCAEELEGLKGDESPMRRSVSPKKTSPVEMKSPPEDTLRINPFECKTSSPIPSPEEDHYDSYNYSIIAKEHDKGDDEVSNFLIESEMPLNSEPVHQEQVAVKKDVTLKSSEKNLSTEVLTWTIGLYEKMVRNDKLVNGFLKQIQKDFAFVVSHLEKNEPQVLKEVENAFIEKFVNKKTEETNHDQVKAVKAGEHPHKQQMESDGLVKEPNNVLKANPVPKVLNEGDLILFETQKMLEEMYTKIIREATKSVGFVENTSAQSKGNRNMSNEKQNKNTVINNVINNGKRVNSRSPIKKLFPTIVTADSKGNDKKVKVKKREWDEKDVLDLK